MLVHMPRGPADRQPKPADDECGGFEAGLRRDLAMASVVSYEAMLGGWRKRSLDLIIVLTTLPLWAPAVLTGALWAKLARGSPVFCADERIGYGGRRFRLYSLRVGAPEDTAPESSAVADSPSGLDVVTMQTEAPRTKWTRLLERLPQLFNVIRGDVSLVGPEPLTQHGLEQLKSARRYYLSARPGIFDIGGLVRGDQRDGRFKAYALSWSVMLDLLLMWDGVRGFHNRGELWRPGFLPHRVVPGLEADQRSAAARRRTASPAD